MDLLRVRPCSKSVEYRPASRAHCSTAAHRIISVEETSRMIRCSFTAHSSSAAWRRRAVRAPACASTSGLTPPSHWLHIAHVVFAATHSMLRSEGQPGLDNIACPMLGLYQSCHQALGEPRQHAHERNALRCTWSSCKQKACRFSGIRRRMGTGAA